MPHLASNLRVPRNGDVAHRKGFCKLDNPFTLISPKHDEWNDDWEFRHKHAGDHAQDGINGNLRPSITQRARGCK